MIRHRAVVFFLAVLIGATGRGLAQDAPEPEAPAKAIEITGLYRCEGGAYTGTVTITKLGDTYLLRWQMPRVVYVGVGIRRGDVLASSWTSGRGRPGIVVYQIEEGPRLVGHYASYPGNGRTGKEILTFRRDLPKLPAPRAWKVGEAALVNWSRDTYWYPAHVARIEGERYFVRFDDGDEEWTDATRMTPDDIVVGDRVYGKWQRRGRYYPGKVTTRDGTTIHIRYDDGGEEDTTIRYVRVLRPKMPADEP